MLSDKASKKIRVLSMVLFVGVMMIHTYNLEVYGIEPDRPGSILAALESFLYRFANGTCVSFFFFISGFLFFRNFRFSLLVEKYRSRLKSIVFPYLVWNTIYYLFFVCITRIPVIANAMNGDRLAFGAAEYVKYVWEGYYTLWFLRVLIWMILLAPVLYLLLKRRKYYWAEPALVLLLLIGLGKTPVTPGIINVYYVLGAYLGMNFGKLANKGNRRLSVAAALCLPVMVFLGGGYAGHMWYTCLLFAVIWLAMDLFAFERDVKWWMKCTFFYYCAHDVILEAVEKVILIAGGKSEVMAWIDYLSAPVITLAVLIGAAWLLRKHMRPVWGILSGGRQGTT